MTAESAHALVWRRGTGAMPRSASFGSSLCAKCGVLRAFDARACEISATSPVATAAPAKTASVWVMSLDIFPMPRVLGVQTLAASGAPLPHLLKSMHQNTSRRGALIPPLLAAKYPPSFTLATTHS